MLRFHNVPELFVAKLLQHVTDSDVETAVNVYTKRGHNDPRYLHRLITERLLAGYFMFEPLDFSAKSSAKRIMLVGQPGIGKTLTTAKLAARIALSKQPFTVITTDTKRAGGIEQLQAFTTILEQELLIANSRTELWKMLKSIPDDEALIIDTAGCNPFQTEEWEGLQAIATLEGIEPILVMPAGGDSLDAIDMVEIYATLPIRRLLVTRADSARRFGGILAVAAAHQLAFCDISNTPGMIDALHPASAATLAELLLRYQLQT